MRAAIPPPTESEIPSARKTICSALIAAAFVAAMGGQITGVGEAAPQSDAGDLIEAELSQSERQLVLTIRTSSPVPLARLDRLPLRQQDSPHLCLVLHRAGGRGERWLCLGGSKGDAHRRIGLLLVNAAGTTTRESVVAARVRRPHPQTLVLSLPPDRIGVQPHRYRWRVLEDRRGCRGCGESLPSRGSRLFRLRPVRAVGCTGGSAGLLRYGSRERRAVALTFDDGPGSYTEDFLAVLREERARATFFEIGQEMAGREDVMRRILRDGNEIGNHSTHHSFYPSYSDLAATNALIRSATHFQPCLFRPPGGVVDSGLVATAGQLGMKTILWDVDPGDWTNPGSGTVYSHVVGAVQAGSIVVMHDGGGDRSGTLAALAAIIDTLRSRGYRFVTVSELLGQRLIYKPYG